MKIHERIQGCVALPAGWHYGSGIGTLPSVARHVTELANEALRLGFDSMDCFPGIEGELSLCVYVGEKDHSFQVWADDSVRYWDEADPNSHDETLTLEEATARLRAIRAALDRLTVANP